MTVKADILLVAHLYGGAGNVTIGKRLDGANKVDSVRHTGVVIHPDIANLANRINQKNVDIPDSSVEAARHIAESIAAAIDPAGNSWEVEDLIEAGLHIWDPRLGWVILGMAEFSHAFRLMRDAVPNPVPYGESPTVNGQALKLDFLVVVQSPR